MKLSKKVWIIVGAGIIVVLLVILFMTYFGQVGEQEDLNNRLTTAEKGRTTLAAQEEELENQLSQAQSLLSASQEEYPQEIHSIEYGEHIFEIAEKCNLTLSSLSFPRPSATQVSLSLPLSGTVADIFEFINIINTDDRFASTQVNSVNLNVGGGGAIISITIYIYQR